MSTAQVSMPRQEPSQRIRNFDEVALGYTKEMAEKEASRCLGCKNPRCVKGCPVGVNIPEFIRRIREGDSAGALAVIMETNSLPAVCGRVCPQEKQCQKQCIMAGAGKPLAIGRLERYAADNAFGSLSPSVSGEFDGFRVAVVGSGPSGLTVAGALAKKGFRVTVFEALHKPGGVLRYGIPEFRLPREVLDREINYIRSLGAEFIPNAPAGRAFEVTSLFDEGFHAVFLGTGSGAPKLMGIKGEDLPGVFSGNEWLTRINLMRAYRSDYLTPMPKPGKTVVIGAGNTAMDCARTARRTGAESVTIIYRRSRAEMPAREEEIHHAAEEGVRFRFLLGPAEFLGEKTLQAVLCSEMELGEPDQSGRRRPKPTGKTEVIAADCAIVALGQTPNPLIRDTTPGLETAAWGGIPVDPETGMTNVPGIFAGGDVVTGSATVISAMGAGRIAAKGIEEYIRAKYM
ncbi:MAG: NADPH-dependent glutamate synthase [Abditibacteriota bacterium]|nr:NADPH-dependent glutamate synthase [Abditibacteriota bacterium]